MRTPLSVSLAVAIGALLLSCAPSQQAALESMMYTWVGQPRNDLERAWGPPIAVTRVSTGGSLLIYHRVRVHNQLIEGDRDVGILERCGVEIETDATGKIVRWFTQSPC